MHDFERGLSIEVSYINAAGLTHSRLKPTLHLILDRTQQCGIILKQRRICIDLYRKTAHIAIIRVARPQLRLVGHRRRSIVGILTIIIGSISTAGGRLHVIHPGQILRPENDAHSGCSRLPFRIQVQRQHTAALCQLGFSDQLVVDRQYGSILAKFRILVIIVAAVGIGRRVLIQIPPTGKSIAGSFRFSYICKINIATQRNLLSGDVGIVGIEDHAVGIRRLVINIHHRIRILNQLLGISGGLELFVYAIDLRRSAGHGADAALESFLIQADIGLAVCFPWFLVAV